MSISFLTSREAKLRPLSALSAHSGQAASSIELQRKIEGLRTPSPSSVQQAKPNRTMAESLYDALASYKVWTASVAMHMDPTWRSRLFRQLDSLLDCDEWQEEDLPPSLASFTTFMRLVLLLRPTKAPGLGAAGDGSLIAAWTNGPDKLTVECKPQDHVRWSLSHLMDGEVERAAGITTSDRVSAVLDPYRPEKWFDANLQAPLHAQRLHP